MRFVHLCVVVWWKTVLAPGDWVQYVHISQCTQSWACMPVICSAVHFSVGGVYVLFCWSTGKKNMEMELVVLELNLKGLNPIK